MSLSECIIECGVGSDGAVRVQECLFRATTNWGTELAHKSLRCRVCCDTQRRSWGMMGRQSGSESRARR
jgi:hypothetical protein